MTNNEYLAIPGPGQAYRAGWQIMKKNFLELLLIVLVQGLLSLPAGYYGRYAEGANFDFISYLFMLAYTFLFYLPLNYGVLYAYLKAARNEKVQATDIFACFRNFWNVVLSNLLITTIIGFGFLFFIFPGIYFLSKLVFVPFYVVDKNMEVIEAIKTSWSDTRGYSSHLFSMVLLAVPVVFLGLLFIGVGVIISFMWIGTSFAYFYNVTDKFLYNSGSEKTQQ